MKVLIYSLKDYERSYLESANKFGFKVDFTDKALSAATAVKAKGYEAISIFTQDTADAPVIGKLHRGGTKFIAVRAAGYDNVDIEKADALGIQVANVPAYSPYAVAEHAMAMILALNRKLVTADRNVHQHDFRVSQLIGRDLHGKTAGIIGTGKTGSVMAKILHGFGCHLVGFDIRENRELVENYHLQYTDLKSLCFASDIISIHLCLTEQTRHIINHDIISYMRPSAILVNTSRGAVIDTDALADALQAKIIGAAGLDVYEREKGIFFQDHTGQELKDAVLRKLLDMPNVLITPHQAFATREALENIATSTFQNLHCWATGRSPGSVLGNNKKTAYAAERHG
jgi:D-lactate dehydrogenase